MQALAIGPWVFSIGVIAILLGLAVANAAAGFLRKRGYGDAGPALWWLLAAALIAARAAFVWRWWPGYQSGPWWALADIRDGGFSPWVGLLVLSVGSGLWLWRRPALRKPLPFAVAAGLAMWGLVTITAVQLRQAAHPPLPELTLQRLDGARVELSQLGGQPAVINLWASWCGPCRREMPMLVAASKTTPGVRFVFVDQGESAHTVRAFLQRENLAPATMLLDAGSQLSYHYNAPGYPTTLFVDAAGRLRDMRIGELTHGALQAHLERIVPSTPTESTQ